MKKIIQIIGLGRFILFFCIFFLFLVFQCNYEQLNVNKSHNNYQSDDYTVASYYFPNYHPDARNIRRYGKRWTEWELVKQARPRFEGHMQPKVPQWGYTDESDPVHMAKKIDAAADHGLDAFIFDWYYYDDGPFLEAAIEKGFFGAQNNNRIKFGLMWANHDWVDIFPADSSKLLCKNGPELLYPGKISLDTWNKMTDYLIQTYFTHPSYWLIDNAPYFSVYDLSKFLATFESVEAAVKSVNLFRQKVKAIGFKDLHLNAVVWGQAILPSEEVIPAEELEVLLKRIGFTSTTSYVWIHHVDPNFPTQHYNSVKEKYFDYASAFDAEMELPYFPNMTMGWDSSPRTRQDKPFRKLGYPYTGIIVDNTPENFKIALQDMKNHLENHPAAQNTFIINCWNEWTEGSYLEPDTVYQMDYLKALNEVFNR